MQCSEHRQYNCNICASTANSLGVQSKLTEQNKFLERIAIALEKFVSKDEPKIPQMTMKELAEIANRVTKPSKI